MKKIFYILLYSFVLVILFWSSGFDFDERGQKLLSFFLFLFAGIISVNILHWIRDEK